MPHGNGVFLGHNNSVFDGRWEYGKRDGKASIAAKYGLQKYSSTCTNGMMGKYEASFLVTPDIPAIHIEI